MTFRGGRGRYRWERWFAVETVLDRARAPLPRSTRERHVAARFAAAFASRDVDGVVALLTDDAWFTMPLVPLEYQGPVAIAAFLRSIAAWHRSRRYRMIPARANGQPAYGLYVTDGPATVFSPHGLIVLTLEGDRISAITRFVDNSVMRWFGLPQTPE